MDPGKIENANVRLNPPEGWDAAAQGDVKPLEILRTRDEHGNLIMQSTWIPDRDELDALNAGAAVVLTIWGGAHPPVAVNVGMPTRRDG